jgi:hypothetical protein
MNFTLRQVSILLCSLRHFQLHLPAIPASLECLLGKHRPSMEEIDALCETINIGVADPPADSPATIRRQKIIALAQEQCGDAEIDDDATLSEGDDNGCYVSAWVWCDFSDTELDKTSPSSLPT